MHEFVFKEFMVASSNGNIYRVTDPLWGETTGHRWIPLTKASDAGRMVIENIACAQPIRDVVTK